MSKGTPTVAAADYLAVLPDAIQAELMGLVQIAVGMSDAQRTQALASLVVGGIQLKVAGDENDQLTGSLLNHLGQVLGLLALYGHAAQRKNQEH